MTYSNPLKKRFGGAAQFALSAGGLADGQYASAPVTIYAKTPGMASAPCTHNASFWGPVGVGNCISAMILAKPTGVAAQGGHTLATSPATTEFTPGAFASQPNIVVAKIGAAPTHVSGTLLPGGGPAAVKPYAVRAATALLPTNAAVSKNGKWTTGRLTIKNTAAAPPETFTLSGRDRRTRHGGGTIQMVSGSLSTRAFTGPNANRGWVELTMLGIHELPALSPMSLGVMAGLMLLGAGYAMRRRIFA
jgi:hypothetical protein